MKKKNLTHEEQLKGIYLGKWVIVNKESGDNTMEAVGVDVAQRKVIFSNGQKIDMMTLDHSGLYEKVHSPLESPEVANEIKTIAHSLQSAGIKDDATGQIQKESSLIVDSRQHENPAQLQEQARVIVTTEETESHYVSSDNEEEALVRQMISVSRKRSKNEDVMSVTVNIPVDFDIVKVIENCESLSMNAESIAKVLVEELRITPQLVRESVKNFLLGDTGDDEVTSSSQDQPKDETSRKAYSEKILESELDKHSRIDDTAELNEDNIDLYSETQKNSLPIVEFNGSSVKVK